MKHITDGQLVEEIIKIPDFHRRMRYFRCLYAKSSFRAAWLQMGQPADEERKLIAKAVYKPKLIPRAWVKEVNQWLKDNDWWLVYSDELMREG